MIGKCGQCDALRIGTKPEDTVEDFTTCRKCGSALRSVPRATQMRFALAEARRLANSTVTDAAERATWHQAVDELLEGPGDDRTQRWDHPGRVRHRQWIRELTAGSAGSDN